MAEKKHHENGKFFTPQDYFDEFKARFEKMSDAELIEAFNREVGNPGWGSARGAYLAALHNEFMDRDIDISEIGDKYSMSLKHKIKLVKKIVCIEE
ncbi:hypothetical protein [Thermotomaculum hydrothermale]|uniref:hypothetical protein n=1 Tax=Thermotomaculum hydrothermale TaxID=981385 RepID=UPI0019154324|nr:hypothetical protein [Thermotomaculum hydrothermale]